MIKKNTNKNIIEIARSYSFKKNLGDYQMADFFCSAKMEVPEKEATKTSKKLFKFCQKEVKKSIEDFLATKTPDTAKLSVLPKGIITVVPEKPNWKQNYAIAKQDAPRKQVEQEAADAYGGENKEEEEKIIALNKVLNPDGEGN